MLPRNLRYFEDEVSVEDLKGIGEACHIYTLHASNDPECRPRYVGFTCRPKVREYTHNRGKEKGRKAAWIRSLWPFGARAVFTIVHTFQSDNSDVRATIEGTWVKLYREKFPDLLNDMAVGQGVAKCSDQHRAKMTAIAKKRGADPAFRAEVSLRMKQRFADPEARLKQSEMRKKLCASPEFRAKMRLQQKKNWLNPGFRERVISGHKKNWEDPEYRKKIGNKTYYSDPQYRAKLSVAKKKACDTAEFRAKMSAEMKRRYADPECRKRIEAVRKKLMVSPEYRARRSEAAKRQWARPEHRAKFLATRALRVYEKKKK